MAATAARAAAARAGDADALARMRARSPAHEEIWLAVDDDAAAAYKTLRSETRLAGLGRDQAARDADTRRLAEARAALEATGAVRWLLRNVGRKAYRQLVESEPCQPTEKDHDDVRRINGQPSARAQWSEQFIFRLVALCAAEPHGVTHEDLAEWVEDGRMSEGEITQLFNAAHALHTGGRVVDLGK